jgi:hypothetical protein
MRDLEDFVALIALLYLTLSEITSQILIVIFSDDSGTICFVSFSRPTVGFRRKFIRFDEAKSINRRIHWRAVGMEEFVNSRCFVRRRKK